MGRLFAFFFLAMCLVTGLSQAETDVVPEKSLKTRPGAGSSPTRVLVAVYVVDLKEIDGPKQNFTADVVVRLRWKDPRLAPSKPGVRAYSLNEIWHPGVQVVNRFSVQTTLPEILEADQEGMIRYRQRYIGQFSTLLDLRAFPFDRQTLSIRLAAPAAASGEIEFVEDVDMGLASPLSITDWNIGRWRARTEAYQVGAGGRELAAFRLEFEATRYFNFYLVQIVIPLTMILCMSWVVFWIDPNQSGPRISISITSMLTLVAYRLLLGSFLPRLSFLTRMDYFVLSSTSLVFLALLNVIFIGRLMLAQKETLAKKVDMHSRWIFPLIFLLVLYFSFFA